MTSDAVWQWRPKGTANQPTHYEPHTVTHNMRMCVLRAPAYYYYYYVADGVDLFPKGILSGPPLIGRPRYARLFHLITRCFRRGGYVKGRRPRAPVSKTLGRFYVHLRAAFAWFRSVVVLSPEDRSRKMYRTIRKNKKIPPNFTADVTPLEGHFMSAVYIVRRV